MAKELTETDEPKIDELSVEGRINLKLAAISSIGWVLALNTPIIVAAPDLGSEFGITPHLIATTLGVVMGTMSAGNEE